MAQKFLVPIDLNRNELQNLVTQNLATAPATPVTGLRYFDTTLGHERVWNGTAWEQASGASGSGSVTSVGLAVPTWLSVSGSPVTSAGTITVAAATGQGANQVLATPNGAAGAAGLRALVSADVPKTLDHTWVTDFDTQVRTSRLDQMAAPTAAVSLNSQALTNVLDPVNPQDATTKKYVDVAIQGVVTKPSANYATTAALPAATYANGVSGVGATLTGTANGALAAIDGQTPVAGDVVLAKNQATAAQNGLYTVTQVGDATHPFIITRHPDLDQAAEFGGALIAVEAGTTNGGSLWLCATNNPTVGTTSINFTEINKAADLAAGTGIAIAGNTVSVATTYAGGTSIATVGTIATGTWQATAIAVLYGGTGATTAAGARTNLGATGKYQATIGNGSATSFTITQATHGLATDSSILVQVLDDGTGNVVVPDVSIAKATGTVTLTFATAPATNAYRVVMIG